MASCTRQGEMASRKRRRGRVGSVGRVGVSWSTTEQKFLVRMAPPSWNRYVQLGFYDTESEAMVARDYGAFLRAAAGEDSSTAGGFNAEGKLYQFEDSHDIFESMDESKARRDQYTRLMTYYLRHPSEKWSGERISRLSRFCKEARNDIGVAIEKFRSTWHLLVTTEPLAWWELVPGDGEILLTSSAKSDSDLSSVSSKISMSWIEKYYGESKTCPMDPAGTLLRDSEAIVGDAASDGDWSDMPVQVAAVRNGSPHQRLLDMTVLVLDDEQISSIGEDSVNKIEDKLDKSCIDKFLEEMGLCPENPRPESIPAMIIPDPEK